MNTLGIAILGLLQGLTEFLPVSSSGHLVIGSTVFKLHESSIALDVLLHLGTLVPVLWLYRIEISAMLRGLPFHVWRWRDDGAMRMLVAVLVGSMPTAIIGFGLRDVFAQLFASVAVVGFALMATGVLLLLTRRASAASTAEAEPWRTLTPSRAVVVGLAQGVAITPGVSRSGATIAAALLLGVERETAARLSFLMSVPAIVGATLLELLKAPPPGPQIWPYLLGALVAGVSGYAALRLVVRFVKRGTLHWFAAYVVPLGLGLVIYSLAPLQIYPR